MLVFAFAFLAEESSWEMSLMDSAFEYAEDVAAEIIISQLE